MARKIQVAARRMPAVLAVKADSRLPDNVQARVQASIDSNLLNSLDVKSLIIGFAVGVGVVMVLS